MADEFSSPLSGLVLATSLSVGCFISASYPSYHCGVISELHNEVVLVGGNTVMCEQCVEDGTENTPLWGANVCYDGV